MINETAMQKLDWVFDYAGRQGHEHRVDPLGLWSRRREGLWADPTHQNFWIDTLVKRYKDRPNLFMYTVANEFERYPDGSYTYSAERRGVGQRRGGPDSPPGCGASDRGASFPLDHRG